MSPKRFAVAGLFLMLFAVAGGCVNEDVRTSVDAWNDCVDVQHRLYNEADKWMKTADAHTTFNDLQLSFRNPNYQMVRENIASDLKNLDKWDRPLNDLSRAISDFAGATTHLKGDAKRYADDALTNVRAYHNEMDSAKRGYQSAYQYCDQYIRSCQRGYPDDSYYNSYQNALVKANDAVERAESHLSRADDSMARLERLQ